VRLALFEQDPRSFSSGELLPMFLLNDIYSNNESYHRSVSAPYHFNFFQPNISGSNYTIACTYHKPTHA
jgi:hypothetical protein